MRLLTLHFIIQMFTILSCSVAKFKLSDIWIVIFELKMSESSSQWICDRYPEFRESQMLCQTEATGMLILSLLDIYLNIKKEQTILILSTIALFCYDRKLGV